MPDSLGYRDNRGTPITSGQTVAYNLSGEVALGDIIAVGESYRSWGIEPLIKVRLAHSAGGHPAGHVSKVRNAKNVLVLKPGDA